MSYFDRLAQYATGDFSRAHVRLQEFVPADLTDPVEPEYLAERPAAIFSPPSPTEGSGRSFAGTVLENESVAPPTAAFTRETKTEATHFATTNESRRETVTSPETHVSVEQRRDEFRTLVQQIRNEFNQTTPITRSVRHEISPEQPGEIRHRTDRHTERIERTTSFSGSPVTKPTVAQPRPAGNNGVSALAPTIGPEIHVHIGRIDVKVPAEKTEKERPTEKPRGVISLDEYLAQRRRN